MGQVVTVSVQASADTTQKIHLAGVLDTAWWICLRLPELDWMSSLALSSNRTLEVARAYLSEAVEGIKVAGAELWPKIDATSARGRQKYGASFLGPEAATFPASVSTMTWTSSAGPAAASNCPPRAKMSSWKLSAPRSGASPATPHRGHPDPVHTCPDRRRQDCSCLRSADAWPGTIPANGGGGFGTGRHHRSEPNGPGPDDVARAASTTQHGPGGDRDTGRQFGR